MSETRFIQGTVIKIGETQGGLPKLALKVKDGSFRIAVLQIGSTLPALQAEFKQGNFTAGSDLDGCKTYYEQPLEMKGDTHQDLNPGEAPIAKVVDKAVVVTHEIAWCSDPDTLVVCTAVAAAKGDESKVDFWINLIDSKIKERNSEE